MTEANPGVRASVAEAGYSGAALLRIGTARVDVQVELRGFFQPIDGRYHWYGRIARNDKLAAIVGGSARAVLETRCGTSGCELSDIDLWGRYRVAGLSTPPFLVPIETDIDAEETDNQTTIT